jgi:predicted RND superfamily exporter protein
VPALGFRISPFTVPLFPLLTGIHLTLLIHIGTVFQAARRSGLGVELAMSAMLGQVLKACAFAALTTTVGLLTLSFSEVRPTAVFGQLGACGIVALFVLTFGPGMALLRVLGQLTVAGNPWEQSSKVTWPTALVDRVMRWRSMILLASILVIVAVCFGWSRVRTDIRIVEFLNPKSETRLAMEGLDRDYGGINFAKIEINTGRENGVLRRECFSLLNRMEQFALKQDAGVSMGYSAAMLVRAADGLLRKDIPWVGNVPSGLRARFIMQAFQQPEVKRDTPLLGFLYDENLQRAYLMLRMRDLSSDRYLKLLDDVVKEGQAHAPKDWQVTAVDSKAAILEADRRIVDSQRDSAMWTIGIIGVLLAILWRSLSLALLALVANAIPVGLVVAVQGLAGVPLNSVTIMVAAIAFGIAVDDTIHFITHWRDERRRGVGSREAVLNTLRVKGRPIVCTTIILIGIMCVFFLASFPPAVAFGWLSAIGFAGALVAALGLLPIALARDE